jgi:hypothetical protein
LSSLLPELLPALALPPEVDALPLVEPLASVEPVLLPMLPDVPVLSVLEPVEPVVPAVPPVVEPVVPVLVDPEVLPEVPV